MFFKVSPMKGAMKLVKKGNLSLRYIGLFEVLEDIGPVAYRLALAQSLSRVHFVFMFPYLSNNMGIMTTLLNKTLFFLKRTFHLRRSREQFMIWLFKS